MQRSFLLSTAALAACLLARTASADTMETVVVSATRTEQPQDRTGASLTVLDASALQTQQTVVLTDILKEVPSLVVNRTGGIGQTTTVSLRGAEQGQTVTLIDGVRINDPSDVSEGAVYGDVLANNISRVEILRGPQSTLYGSDAIGGVVDIITRRGGDSPFALDASAEGGSFGTFHANVAANGTDGSVEYGTGVNYFTNTGISMADRRNGNTENDGYTNYGATANVRVHISDTVSADLRGYYTHGHADFDDNFGGPPLFAVADSGANNSDELKAGYLGLNADFFGGKFQSRIAIIATSSGRQYFDSAFDTIHLNFDDYGDAVRFEYQGIVDLDPDTQVTFGAETQESSFRGDSFSSFAPPDVTVGQDRISGYYLQGQATLFAQLTLTGGVRLDDDDEFGTHTSYKLNAAWNIPGWDATLRGNIGNGFKAPSLFQLFSANSNPIARLKPETATGWEIGFDKQFWDDRLKASLTYFQRHTSNQIDFQNCFAPGDAPGCPQRLAAFGYYVNLDRTRATGVEAELAAKLSETLNLSLNYTNMSATNVVTHLDLARRPQNLASAVVTWTPWSGTSLGLSATYEGKRFNDNANLTPLTSNTQVNLFGAYDLTERWQLFGRIDNVFNDRTEEVTGYGVPGIGTFAGIRATL
ncbi:MAG TPA: TonB-dependent receptor [Rhizomicrobium sp.]|jgi:vitamin B12 transporter|nr:TonB-dependent receptor [Rhizomicrobium sp.]